MLNQIARGLQIQPTTTEATYYGAWCAQVAPLRDPLHLALAGGLLADRFPWVFCAGYQAAIRRLFPELALQGWSAVAVSEDRATDNPLPGLGAKPTDTGWMLSGYKTWVAACNQISSLLVTATTQDQRTLCLHVSVGQTGLTLSANPQPSMLPDLSQGRAHFDGLPVATEARLDAQVLKKFGAFELFYIFAAFLASCWQQHPAERDRIDAIVADLAPVHDQPQLSRRKDLLDLNQAVQQLRQDLSAGNRADDAAWQRDQRLIAMYDFSKA